MVAKRMRNHCATCGVKFAKPKGYAYCSKACENNRRGFDRVANETEMGVDSWLDRIYARRLDLGRDLEIAMPWDQEKIRKAIAATYAEEERFRKAVGQTEAV